MQRNSADILPPANSWCRSDAYWRIVSTGEYIHIAFVLYTVYGRSPFTRGIVLPGNNVVIDLWHILGPIQSVLSSPESPGVSSSSSFPLQVAAHMECLPSLFSLSGCSSWISSSSSLSPFLPACSFQYTTNFFRRATSFDETFLLGSFTIDRTLDAYLNKFRDQQQCRKKLSFSLLIFIYSLNVLANDRSWCQRPTPEQM